MHSIVILGERWNCEDQAQADRIRIDILAGRTPAVPDAIKARLKQLDMNVDVTGEPDLLGAAQVLEDLAASIRTQAAIARDNCAKDRLRAS